MQGCDRVFSVRTVLDKGLKSERRGRYNGGEKDDPFFAVDYKAAGIVMAVIGAFCIVSGLCQKVVKGEKER